jgi:prophage regulatory protein
LLYNNSKTGALKMVDGLIKLNRVKEITSFSTSTIYRLIDKGEFPKRINLGLRNVFWVEEEIHDYIAERIKPENRY